ncbi:hypothetical protein [Actinomadura sp. DC4]|uniref:hypothetical protein n=1 Tax=Actinomadura sp. DC4 TaxID=3055069 RepID=UPI0025B27300|nr:hypothetical protein [Actinomadura sp. DC4]MDN3357171.1 hypothetical protein [Actinomadura sp. DC4]
MTRGRAATPDPFDLSAVNSSDELFDALSARRLGDHADDPAAALLTALVTDVDSGAPPLVAAPARVGCGRQSNRRRGTRAVVTFGVAALVMTSAGAAAAGGSDGTGAMGMAHPPTRPRGTERSNENLQHQDPITGTVGRRPAVRRPAEKHRTTPTSDASPRAAEAETKPAPEGQQPWAHRGHWTYPHVPADLHHSPNHPDPRSTSDDRSTPTSHPEPTPATP